MDRISQLEAFMKEDPNDPFNRYALALEYLKVDVAKAQTLFQELLKAHPEYLPTYYPFAHLLLEKKKYDEAESIFTSGMQQAKLAGNQKTFRELQAAYNDWLFEKD